MKKKLLSIFKKNKKDHPKKQSDIKEIDPKVAEHVRRMNELIVHTKNEATIALDGVNTSELHRLFIIENPPAAVYDLFHCCLNILAGLVPSTMIEVNDQKNPISDNWAACRRMLIHIEFLESLRKLKDVHLDETKLNFIEEFRKKDHKLPDYLIGIAGYLVVLFECDKLYIKTMNEANLA